MQTSPTSPAPAVLEADLARGDVVAAWDALADATGAEPWDRPGWVMAWYEAFGRGTSRVLVSRRDGRLSGVLPLERRRRALRAPANWHTPGFAGVFADAAAARTLLDACVRQPVRHVELSFLDAGSPLVEASEQVCEQRGLARHVRVIERSPFLTLPGDADAVDAALSAKRRSGLRRLARRLDARGAVTLDVRGGDEELDALLDEGFAVERSGWKGRRGTGIADDATTRAFYTHVARWAAGRGWLRLGFLRLDGRAIAFDLALEAGRVHYLLKTGYDESLRSLAPGILLRHAMIRRAAAEGCRRYEFLGHEAPWKREWARETHARLQLHLFPATPAGRADRLLVAGLLPLGRRVRAGLGR